jgi:hypothetical protein
MRDFVCAYDYAEIDGLVLMQKRRYITDDARGKAFEIWSRSRPDFMWNRGLGPYRQSGRKPDGLLYPAPESVIRAGVEALYWGAGEKDADNLIKAGVAATTHWQGEGWNKAKPQQVRRIMKHRGLLVLCVDWDVVGLADGLWRYDLLTSYGMPATRLSVVASRTARSRPPRKHGQDVSDHLEAGYGVEDLRPISPAYLRQHFDRHEASLAKVARRAGY